jgi:hypothetical protein
MVLQSKTVASQHTDTENCFYVRTGSEVWVLLASSQQLVEQWTTAISAQVHAQYLRVSVCASVRIPYCTCVSTSMSCTKALSPLENSTDIQYSNSSM